MNTFSFKWWRFAWLSHHNWGWRTTVVDGSGRWRKVFGPLCFLVERRSYSTAHKQQEVE